MLEAIEKRLKTLTLSYAIYKMIAIFILTFAIAKKATSLHERAISKLGAIEKSL